MFSHDASGTADCDGAPTRDPTVAPLGDFLIQDYSLRPRTLLD